MKIKRHNFIGRNNTKGKGKHSSGKPLHVKKNTKRDLVERKYFH